MSFRIILLAAVLARSFGFAWSAPILGIGDTESHAAVSTLSSDKTNAFIRPARFSQVAYCSSASVLSWKCGAPCDALPGIQPIVAGGNNGQIPRYYIAHDPTAQSIVIAHQGTNFSNENSVKNDIDALTTSLDKSLFPNVSSSIEAHEGFSETFARTANDILGNVTAALKSKGVKKVEVHGHSLGAAIGLMDAVFLRKHLDTSVSVSATIFANPRGGNQDWANFVDKAIPGLVHIHNKNDPVGILPPRITGYQHASGQIHIQADGSSVNCPGQENQDSKCLHDTSIFDPSLSDHSGPYYGISMGSAFCP